MRKIKQFLKLIVLKIENRISIGIDIIGIPNSRAVENNITERSGDTGNRQAGNHCIGVTPSCVNKLGLVAT